MPSTHTERQRQSTRTREGKGQAEGPLSTLTRCLRAQQSATSHHHSTSQPPPSLPAYHDKHKFETIYHSTLLRCAQTAGVAAHTLGLSLTPMPALAECAAAVRLNKGGLHNFVFLHPDDLPLWCVSHADDELEAACAAQRLNRHAKPAPVDCTAKAECLDRHSTETTATACSSAEGSLSSEALAATAATAVAATCPVTDDALHLEAPHSPRLPRIPPPRVTAAHPHLSDALGASETTACLEALCRAHRGQALLCCTHREAIRDLLGGAGHRMRAPYACVGVFVYSHSTNTFRLLNIHDAARVRGRGHSGAVRHGTRLDVPSKEHVAWWRAQLHERRRLRIEAHDSTEVDEALAVATFAQLSMQDVEHMM